MFEVLESLEPRQLRELTDYSGSGPVISMFCSCGGNDLSGPSGRVQLKNFLAKSRTELSTGQFPPERLRKALAPLDAFYDSYRSWVPDTQIALYSSPELTTAFRLLKPVRPKVFVGNRFFVKPLFSLLEGSPSFSVLCLSKGLVEVHEYSKAHWKKLELPGLPSQFDEVLEEYDFEKSLQFRTESFGSKNKQEARFHGHGAGGDQANLQSKLIDFIKRVDGVVCEHLSTQRSPLVVCSVEYLAKLFLDISSYSNLLPDCVYGSPTQLDDSVIFSQSMDVVSRHLQEERRKRFEEHLRLQHTELCSTSTDEVLLASLHGAVESLFVKANSEVWGQFDPESAQVQITECNGAQNGAFHVGGNGDELLNIAVINTFKRHGDVFLVHEDEKIMNGLNVSAMFRYPIAKL